jgi:hypothetical protein
VYKHAVKILKLRRYPVKVRCHMPQIGSSRRVCSRASRNVQVDDLFRSICAFRCHLYCQVVKEPQQLS